MTGMGVGTGVIGPVLERLPGGGASGVGRSCQPNRPASQATPRSYHCWPSQCSSCTGIASSTSLATITPSMRAGSASCQRSLCAQACSRCA